MEYREALRLKPDYAQAHYNLAMILAAKGKKDEAARDPKLKPPRE